MNTKLGSLLLLLLSTALLTTATQVSKSWAASDGNWTQLAPSGTLPVTRCAHSVIFDPVRDRLVMFGGVNFTSDFNDVWTVSLGENPNWTQLAPSGTPPSPRQGHSAIYDPVRDRMIVFGGFSYPGYDFSQRRVGVVT